MNRGPESGPFPEDQYQSRERVPASGKGTKENFVTKSGGGSQETCSRNPQKTNQRDRALAGISSLRRKSLSSPNIAGPCAKNWTYLDHDLWQRNRVPCFIGRHSS